MKKILSFLFALALLFTISTSSFAQDTLSKHTPSDIGKQKFEEYLASIPSEQAQMILDDPDLVRNMQMEYYWEPAQASTLRATSLPLSSYPAGSYYSYSSTGCSCHSGCTWDVPSSASQDRCYITSSHTSGNCKLYRPTLAIQCKGFADYVYKQYTGHDVGNSYAISNCPTTITNDSAGQTQWRNFANSLSIGSNVRVTVRGQSYKHSFIVKSKSSTGLTIYDANRVSNNCKVAVTTLTWAQLAQNYSGVSNAWR